MTWALPKAPDVQFIGFSTGWGSAGEFRIWRKTEADESYSEAFTLGVPHGAIPGSERAAASLIGVSAPQPGPGGCGPSSGAGPTGLCWETVATHPPFLLTSSF